MSDRLAPTPAPEVPNPQPSKMSKGAGFLRIIILFFLFAWIADQVGCDSSDKSRTETRSFPYETTLVDSQANGGWVLFDSAPESYDPGRTVGLEEEAKVRVTGPAVSGLTSDTRLYPVIVLSGKYAGRNGWVISAALPY